MRSCPGGPVALISLTAMALASCQQTSGGDIMSIFSPEPTQSAAASQPAANVMDQAAQCGRSLGVAVRCNLLGGDSSFAVLRFMALDGLKPAGAAEASQPVTTAFDMGTLEMIHSIGSCQASDAEMAILEREIEQSLEQCAGP